MFSWFSRLSVQEPYRRSLRVFSWLFQAFQETPQSSGENGYDDLDQLRSMTGEDLAEVTSDVGLVEKRGHLKRFYAGVENLKTAKKGTAALDCTESVILKRLALI